MNHKNGITRRDALARGTAISGFSFLPAKVLGRGGALAPSDKMNVAFIGIGGLYGPRALQELASHNIVAVCDIDWRKANPGARGVSLPIEVANKYPQAKKFDDWRVMLQEMNKGIDGVVVCSADHTHAHASITAMKIGKHVFCEKPLARTVHEIRAMMAAEKKYKVATQHGVQGHASEDLLSMVEWIKDGAIGDVKEVHVFEGARPANAPRPAGAPPAPAPSAYYDPIKHIQDVIPVPPEVKWDLFVGPAPLRPWNPMYTPLRWRDWVDFGTGLLGDHGSHFFDPVFTALDLGLPETIEAETDPEYGPEQSAQMWPRIATVRLTFAARGKMPAVTLTWHANNMPPMPKGWKEGDKFPTGGGMFVGSKGALIYASIYQGKAKEVVPDMVRLFPDELDRSYKRPAKTLPRPESQWLEWVESAKTHKPASTNFQQSGLVCQACMLGDIGILNKGKILHYDVKAGKFANNEAANQMLQRKYREGWPLPA
jgi:predicted dehydrogenase